MISTLPWLKAWCNLCSRLQWFCALALSLLIHRVHSSFVWETQTEQNMLRSVAGRGISGQGMKDVQFRQAHVNELWSPKDTEIPVDTLSTVWNLGGEPGLMVRVLLCQSSFQGVMLNSYTWMFYWFNWQNTCPVNSENPHILTHFPSKRFALHN